MRRMSAAFDPKMTPPSVFPARDAAAYEQIMGRWSRRLAPPLIEFGGLRRGGPRSRGWMRNRQPQLCAARSN